MDLILFLIYFIAIGFLLFHFIFFCTETIKIRLNPRPLMSNDGPRFHEVEKIKSQKMYSIEAR